MAPKRKLFTVKHVLIWVGALLLGFGLSMMSFGVPQQDHTLYGVDPAALADGVYTGEFKVVAPFGTFVANRRFTVSVEVSEGRLRAVEILEPKEMGDAFPELEARILTEQTTALDGISGATWSKIAYLKATETALTGGTAQGSM